MIDWRRKPIVMKEYYIEEMGASDKSEEEEIGGGIENK
jgi:hypothetical protein